MYCNCDKNIKKQAGAELGQAQFSLVRVVDEVTVIFNSVEVEIEVIFELSLLVLVGGRVVEKKTKLMLYSTQLKLKLKLELSLAISKLNNLFVVVLYSFVGN